MAALRTRISTLFVILVVAAIAATVGYQLASSTATQGSFDRSTSIDLLDRKKGPPPACYKNVGSNNPDVQNRNCSTGGG